MRSLIFAIVVSVLGLPVVSIAAEEIVVYSARKEHLVKPLFDEFEKETGVTIKYITDKAGPLLQRLKAEGKRSPADLLITVDAGNLWHAANEGVLQPVKSELLDQKVPAHLRDPEDRWFGVTIRARTIVYNTDNVADGELTTYEDLASEKWKDRLCLRTSKKVYNQSLVAMMISRHGEEKAAEIVSGWVNNLALPPFSNDTKTIQAVQSGQCDVAIVNTYYFGRLEDKGESQGAALFWPNQETSGVHVNISGIGLTQHAPHKETAVRFIEWMVSDKAQSMLANMNFEYPVVASVETSELVKNWGTFKSDDINLSEAGRLQSQAVRLMDRAGYK